LAPTKCHQWNHQNHFTQKKHDSKCGRKFLKKQGEAPIAYLGGGFHGHNGLDVETIVDLFKLYISLVLFYGLELILPTTSSLLLLLTISRTKS
jgi:hypothetical protein